MCGAFPVIVRVIAPLVADLTEDFDDVFAFISSCDLDEGITESLTEVSVLHKVGSFAVCDHIVVDSLCDADDACLLYHIIGAAEFLFPVRRIFCADMAVGDHEVCLSGGEAGKGGGIGIRLDRICEVSDGLSVALV